MPINVEEFGDRIDVVTLRGFGVDLYGLEKVLSGLKAGEYDLIGADPFYRFLPAGISENSNSEIMLLFNKIDEYAATLDAGCVNIHHASKGLQGEKAVREHGCKKGNPATIKR